MTRAITGPEIERLIQLLSRLPGLGPRSARRATLQLLRKKEPLLGPLAAAMADAYARVKVCSTCGNADTCDPCILCTDPTRNDALLIVVEDIADVWALERADALKARYHILGGVLSPLDGKGPDDLNLKQLVARVSEGKIAEVVLAMNATVDGQATAHYISDLLSPFDVKLTRLAHGVPVGGELDYLDEGTLSAAMRQRTLL